MPASAQSSHGGGVWSYFGFGGGGSGPHFGDSDRDGGRHFGFGGGRSYFGFGDRDGGRHFSDDHGGREPDFGVGGGRPPDVHPAPLPLAGAGLPSLGLALSAYGLVRATRKRKNSAQFTTSFCRSGTALLARRCRACHGSARGSVRFWSASIAHDHRLRKMLRGSFH